MSFIKNYDQLAKTPQRKIVLDLVEAALDAIQPEKIIRQKVNLREKILKIDNQQVDLTTFQNVYILGFGKGSALNCKILEDILGDSLTAGFVIDTQPQDFGKIEFTQGTHPLPSQPNLDFTKKATDFLGQTEADDLVLVVTCGGGSVMLAQPHNLTLEQMIEVNKALLHSGATISEMNVIRKHLDAVKGGGLAKILFPSTVINMVFSDVPGNDLTTIASGPTVKDPSTEADVANVIDKYNLADKLSFARDNFIESPKDPKYFEKVKNVIVLSNDTAISAMEQKAQSLGIKSKVLTDSFESDANEAGKVLLAQTEPQTILLVGGETSLKVTGTGKGGRNQQLVMAALPALEEGTVICSFDTDGWDNTEAAGALADSLTAKTAKEKDVATQNLLQNNDSFTFFEKVGDAILTGRLPSNVSDLMIVYKS